MIRQKVDITIIFKEVNIGIKTGRLGSGCRLLSPFWPEEERQEHAPDKAADVRPPGNAGAGKEGRCAVFELQEKPEAKKSNCRNFHDREKEN